ncbi:MAG: hypothetical protein N2Z23_09585 [Pyrinomonadaceae bacterium]|nr:hypothetical protein [Pyrinomonadaceae bacterium]MCX7640673.1 hypothetical protein [Pyrinomonadaceae bacterium]MDW8305357.1 hypothetical protein [Acidobacteriota bacterium]
MQEAACTVRGETDAAKYGGYVLFRFFSKGSRAFLRMSLALKNGFGGLTENFVKENKTYASLFVC